MVLSVTFIKNESVYESVKLAPNEESIKLQKISSLKAEFPQIATSSVELVLDYFGDETRTALAVAMAESAGNPSAVNTRNRNKSTDSGLLQCNSIHRNKGETVEEFKKRMFNVEENVKLAYQVYLEAGSTFRPWVAFNENLHLKYLAVK